MKKNLVALLALGLMFSNDMAGQESSTAISAKHGTEEVINHRVALGETVVLIAKKYVIRPSDIYELNPDAVEGISPGTVLRIPIGRSLSSKEFKGSSKSKPAPVKHNTVSAPQKEEYLLAANKKETETIEEVIPQKEEVIVEETVVEATSVELPDDGVFEVTHHVTSGETLTSLSRRYNTTVTAITNANKAKLRNGLQTGQDITIPAGPTPETLEGVVIHEVQAGETLIGLARKYNTTVEAITEYNKRKLKHGLQTGQKLSIMPGQLK